MAHLHQLRSPPCAESTDQGGDARPLRVRKSAAHHFARRPLQQEAGRAAWPRAAQLVPVIAGSRR
eukprot:3308296-Alexandrium_andersonii.AAC.1